MENGKRYYVLGKVYYQDETSRVELLGDEETLEKASDLISDIMNRNFRPENIFVIEGVKKNISIKSVRIE
jgi:hypothetical protein